MKKILFSIYALSLFTATYAQKLDRSIRPKAGPAPEIKLGNAESFTLDNGLKVFVVENHKLPAVTYSIQLDVRPEVEGNKSGMKEMVGELITSGTQTRSKDKFDEETDFISAQINAGSKNMTGHSLTKYQDQLLNLMSDALLNANFQQSDLDRLKQQALAGLQAGKNEPNVMLNNVSGVLNFGAAHPYGEVNTEETINNITLADCNAYYKKYFRPNVAYLAIVGDVNVSKAKEMAKKYFGKWEKADVVRAQYPAAVPPAATEVDFVPRDGAVQSVISITYPVDLMIGTPDVIKTRVLNQVLGGSFQRLDRNLRETHAWTYGSNSSISSDELVGNVDVNVKCRNEVTDSSITEMLKEMNTMRNTPLTADELQGAVNFLSGVFALGLENPQTIAQYAINIDRYHMPKDYYKNYLKTLSATTTADVQTAAQKYLKTDNAHIVVVGNKSEVEKLKKFGEVKYYDNYGHAIKPVETKAVAAGVKAQDIMDKYINAIGGRKAVEGIRSLNMVSGTDMQGTPIKLTQSIVSPTKYKMSVEVMGNVMQKIVMNGAKGFMEAQGKKQELQGAELAEYKQQADLQADLHPEQYGIVYSLKGIEPVNGSDAYVVEEVSKDSKKSTKYYDVASGFLVKSIEESEAMGQKMVQTTTYSDYREVKNGSGYKVPFSLEQTPPGMKIAVTSAEANTEIKDVDFQ